MQDVAATKLVLIRSMFRATRSIVCELFVNTYQRMIRGAIDPAGHLQDLWVQRVAAGRRAIGALIAAAEQRDEATAQQLLQAILDEMLAIGLGPGARVGGVTEKEMG